MARSTSISSGIQQNRLTLAQETLLKFGPCQTDPLFLFGTQTQVKISKFSTEHTLLERHLPYYLWCEQALITMHGFKWERPADVHFRDSEAKWESNQEFPTENNRDDITASSMGFLANALEKKYRPAALLPKEEMGLERLYTACGFVKKEVSGKLSYDDFECFSDCLKMFLRESVKEYTPAFWGAVLKVLNVSFSQHNTQELKALFLRRLTAVICENPHFFYHYNIHVLVQLIQEILRTSSEETIAAMVLRLVTSLTVKMVRDDFKEFDSLLSTLDILEKIKKHPLLEHAYEKLLTTLLEPLIREGAPYPYLRVKNEQFVDADNACQLLIKLGHAEINLSPWRNPIKRLLDTQDSVFPIALKVFNIILASEDAENEEEESALENKTSSGEPKNKLDTIANAAFIDKVRTMLLDLKGLPTHFPVSSNDDERAHHLFATIDHWMDPANEENKYFDVWGATYIFSTLCTLRFDTGELAQKVLEYAVSLYKNKPGFSLTFAANIIGKLIDIPIILSPEIKNFIEKAFKNMANALSSENDLLVETLIDLYKSVAAAASFGIAYETRRKLLADLNQKIYERQYRHQEALEIFFAQNMAGARADYKVIERLTNDFEERANLESSFEVLIYKWVLSGLIAGSESYRQVIFSTPLSRAQIEKATQFYEVTSFRIRTLPLADRQRVIDILHSIMPRLPLFWIQNQQAAGNIQQHGYSVADENEVTFGPFVTDIVLLKHDVPEAFLMPRNHDLYAIRRQLQIGAWYNEVLSSRMGISYTEDTTHFSSPNAKFVMNNHALKKNAIVSIADADLMSILTLVFSEEMFGVKLSDQEQDTLVDIYDKYFFTEKNPDGTFSDQHDDCDCLKTLLATYARYSFLNFNPDVWVKILEFLNYSKVKNLQSTYENLFRALSNHLTTNPTLLDDLPATILGKFAYQIFIANLAVEKTAPLLTLLIASLVSKIIRGPSGDVTNVIIALQILTAMQSSPVFDQQKVGIYTQLILRKIKSFLIVINNRFQNPENSYRLLEVFLQCGINVTEWKPVLLKLVERATLESIQMREASPTLALAKLQLLTTLLIANTETLLSKDERNAIERYCEKEKARLAEFVSQEGYKEFVRSIDAPILPSFQFLEEIIAIWERNPEDALFHEINVDGAIFPLVLHDKANDHFPQIVVMFQDGSLKSKIMNLSLQKSLTNPKYLVIVVNIESTPETIRKQISDKWSAATELKQAAALIPPVDKFSNKNKKNRKKKKTSMPNLAESTEIQITTENDGTLLLRNGPTSIKATIVSQTIVDDEDVESEAASAFKTDLVESNIDNSNEVLIAADALSPSAVQESSSTVNVPAENSPAQTSEPQLTENISATQGALPENNLTIEPAVTEDTAGVPEILPKTDSTASDNQVPVPPLTETIILPAAINKRPFATLQVTLPREATLQSEAPRRSSVRIPPGLGNFARVAAAPAPRKEVAPKKLVILSRVNKYAASGLPLEQASPKITEAEVIPVAPASAETTSPTETIITSEQPTQILRAEITSFLIVAANPSVDVAKLSDDERLEQYFYAAKNPTQKIALALISANHFNMTDEELSGISAEKITATHFDDVWSLLLLLTKKMSQDKATIGNQELFEKVMTVAYKIAADVSVREFRKKPQGLTNIRPLLFTVIKLCNLYTSLTQHEDSVQAHLKECCSLLCGHAAFHLSTHRPTMEPVTSVALDIGLLAINIDFKDEGKDFCLRQILQFILDHGTRDEMVRLLNALKNPTVKIDIKAMAGELSFKERISRIKQSASKDLEGVMPYAKLFSAVFGISNPLIKQEDHATSAPVLSQFTCAEIKNKTGLDFIAARKKFEAIFSDCSTNSVLLAGAGLLDFLNTRRNVNSIQYSDLGCPLFYRREVGSDNKLRVMDDLDTDHMDTLLLNYKEAFASTKKNARFSYEDMATMLTQLKDAYKEVKSLYDELMQLPSEQHKGLGIKYCEKLIVRAKSYLTNLHDHIAKDLNRKWDIRLNNTANLLMLSIYTTNNQIASLSTSHEAMSGSNNANMKL